MSHPFKVPDADEQMVAVKQILDVAMSHIEHPIATEGLETVHTKTVAQALCVYAAILYPRTLTEAANARKILETVVPDFSQALVDEFSKRLEDPKMKDEFLKILSASVIPELKFREMLRFVATPATEKFTAWEHMQGAEPAPAQPKPKSFLWASSAPTVPRKGDKQRSKPLKMGDEPKPDKPDKPRSSGGTSSKLS